MPRPVPNRPIIPPNCGFLMKKRRIEEGEEEGVLVFGCYRCSSLFFSSSSLKKLSNSHKLSPSPNCSAVAGAGAGAKASAEATETSAEEEEAAAAAISGAASGATASETAAAIAAPATEAEGDGAAAAAAKATSEVASSDSEAKAGATNSEAEARRARTARQVARRVMVVQFFFCLLLKVEEEIQKRSAVSNKRERGIDVERQRDDEKKRPAVEHPIGLVFSQFRAKLAGEVRVVALKCVVEGHLPRSSQKRGREREKAVSADADDAHEKTKDKHHCLRGAWPRKRLSSFTAGAQIDSTRMRCTEGEPKTGEKERGLSVPFESEKLERTRATDRRK